MEEYEARSFVCTICGNSIHVVGIKPEGWPPDICGACWIDGETAECPHVHEDGSTAWVYTGTQYGGDDDRWHGEGRVYCELCGADGDA
jgi:hypothetical protein